MEAERGLHFCYALKITTHVIQSGSEVSTHRGIYPGCRVRLVVLFTVHVAKTGYPRTLRSALGDVGEGVIYGRLSVDSEKEVIYGRISIDIAKGGVHRGPSVGI